MGAILRREFSSYFKSPIGYVFLAVYYLAAGYFFLYLVSNFSNNIGYVFNTLFTVSCLLLPILTMKLFSDERKLKTDQLLLTSPTTLTGLVYGKFLSAFFVYAIGAGITVVFSVLLSAYSTMDWMVVIGNIIGLLLIGAAMISVGLMISSLTESQIISAILTLIITLFLLFIDAIGSLLNLDWLTTVVSSISITQRYSNFTNGILNIADVLFFLSFVVVFNFITVRILEKRRWS